MYCLMKSVNCIKKYAFFFANGVNRALTEWGIDHEEIDLISSHGQTIYHNSEASTKHTLQIVDGDHIARKKGIITISDFRQKNMYLQVVMELHLPFISMNFYFKMHKK